jgi:protein translocase SecG subunit
MLAIFQIILAVVIVGLILLQERSSGMSGLLGGDGGGIYQARRGFESIIFYATIACSALFVVLALYSLVAQIH